MKHTTHITIAALALLAGCVPADTPALPVAIYQWELLDAAALAFQDQIIFYPDPNGLPVEALPALPSGQPFVGKAHHNATCDAWIWISAFGDPNTLAHEIGHVLGLAHDADPDNLMFYRPSLVLRPGQIETAVKTAQHLHACEWSHEWGDRSEVPADR